MVDGVTGTFIKLSEFSSLQHYQLTHRWIRDDIRLSDWLSIHFREEVGVYPYWIQFRNGKKSL